MKYVLVVESAIVTILLLNTDLRCITRYIYNTHRCWYFFYLNGIESLPSSFIVIAFRFPTADFCISHFKNRYSKGSPNLY